MMRFHSSSAYILFLLALIRLCVSTDEKTNSTFKPTKEWQKIENGQSIPPGLHVRINLQTGYKEAKLPDETSQSRSLMATSDGESDKSDSKIDPEELKKILKNIKSDEAQKKNIEGGNFRSYEELKKDFNELNMQVKTDLEILTNLIDNFKKFDLAKANPNIESYDETDDEEVLSTLVDLEYLVHHFDNAREFAKLNGFSEVIHKSLNSTNSEIRSEALRLHGSATQSNPKVQIAALDSGSINKLLKILSFDDDLNVRSRSLYALSCLVRRFPAAQHKLITDGGLTAFASVFDEEKKDLQKLQMKIITLIHDLLFERKDTKMNILEEESKNQTDTKLLDLKERLKQYEKMDMERKLVEQDWCSRISKWFIRQNILDRLQSNKLKEGDTPSPTGDQHDLIEKVVDTLYVLSDICKAQFESENELIGTLFQLRDIYNELAETEANSGDDSSSYFYTSLSNILKILTDKLKVTKHVKEEL